ncbi:MAG: DUF6512 family protein [candidate division WOR-3 bacterium]
MQAYIKSLLYLGIFGLLHFGYDLTHWNFLIPFSGINESVFQHLKMAFWAYLFSSGIEYLLVKRKLNNLGSFWYPRLLATIMVPWFILLIWYLVPALFGKVESLTIELGWSILATYLSGIAGVMMEKSVEKGTITAGFKITILVLFFISAFFYISFTYQLPWIDLFQNTELL